PTFPGITWGGGEMGADKVFIRGLPAVITADDPWDLLAALPELAKFAPIELVQLKALDCGGAGRLAEWPGLRHAVGLSLEGAEIEFAPLPPLTAPPHLGRVRSLVLTNSDFGSFLHWLAAAPALGGLRWLEMDYCYVHNPAIEQLAGFSHLPDLRR